MNARQKNWWKKEINKLDQRRVRRNIQNKSDRQTNWPMDRLQMDRKVAHRKLNNKWKKGWKNERMNESMKEWMNQLMNEWMNEKLLNMFNADEYFTNTNVTGYVVGSESVALKLSRNNRWRLAKFSPKWMQIHSPFDLFYSISYIGCNRIQPMKVKIFKFKSLGIR